MLYMVATPIGNMGDITLRALEVLGQVDLIASEDTRKTGLLLKRHGINCPQMSFQEHNEARAGDRIMALLDQGKSVALVTEAGTPGVSDPGFTLVRRAITAGIPLTALPGPTALIAALVLSGLPVHSFTFRGFPPRKSGARRRFLQIDARSPHTLIFYESPYRLEALLLDAQAVFGERDGALAHELTKTYESVVRGKLSALLESVRQARPRGEYVVLIAGETGRSPTGSPHGQPVDEEPVAPHGDGSGSEPDGDGGQEAP